MSGRIDDSVYNQVRMKVRVITNEVWHEVYGQVSNGTWNLVDGQVKIQIMDKMNQIRRIIIDNLS